MSELRVRRAREVDGAAAERLLGRRLDWATTVSALGARVATRDEEVVGVIVLWPHPGHVLVEALAGADDDVEAVLLETAERMAIGRGTPEVRLDSGVLQGAACASDYRPVLRLEAQRSGFVRDGYRTKRLEA